MSILLSEILIVFRLVREQQIPAVHQSVIAARCEITPHGNALLVFVVWIISHLLSNCPDSKKDFLLQFFLSEVQFIGQHLCYSGVKYRTGGVTADEEKDVPGISG